MTPAINSILASPVSKTTEAPDTELGRDDFLRLLVTQLKNQDPLKPLDNAAFVAELAQFTELEQITKQVDLMEKTSRFTLLPLVGRQVRIVGNALELGAGRALINFRLEGDAQQVRVGIENSAGLHLEVHPANTGPVQLRVSLANHTVHTNVITDRAELGNYLLARQGHLEQAFQTNGLDMGQFRVLVDRQGYGQTGHEGTPHSKDDRPNKQDHDRGDPAPQDDTPGRTHTGEAERTLHLVA